MAFAVTGAFRAIEHGSDIVGIIILTTITGVAGGIFTRHCFWADTSTCYSKPTIPHNNGDNCRYPFCLYRILKKNTKLLKFDAIGLGVFTVIGATFAYNLVGLNFLAMAFSGITIAIRGSRCFRDVFVNELPIVFVEESAGLCSLLGVVTFFGLLVANFDFSIAAELSSIAPTTGLRSLANEIQMELASCYKQNR